MPTWKEESERQARYVQQIRPDAYTMPLPENSKHKKEAKKPKKEAKKPKKLKGKK